MPFTAGYSVRFEGQVLPVNTGTHGFVVQGSGGIRLTVNGKVIIDNLAEWFPRVHQGVIDLQAGQRAEFLLEFSQRSGASRCRLLWSQPERELPDVAQLLERVRRDGTTLVVVDRADTWMEQIAKATAVRSDGSFKQGRNWLGGVHFVREHPLFADLPVNVGMNWPCRGGGGAGRPRPRRPPTGRRGTGGGPVARVPDAAGNGRGAWCRTARAASCSPRSTSSTT